MKANQKFANADEAVSPVIGVILMVAITVVLAAVVFVLVSDLGGDSSVASFPNVSAKEADAGEVQLEHLGGECITLGDYTFRLNDNTLAASDITKGSARDVTTDDSTFCVGDKIYLTHTSVSDGTTVNILVIDDDAQSQVYKKTIQL